MEKWYYFDDIKKQTFGTREKCDNNIYTFDIETTSIIEVDGVIYPAIKYDEYDSVQADNLRKQGRMKFYANMYIWQFGVNENVYYGRTWEELKEFLTILDTFVPEKKFVFVHNLSFEFQFLKGEFSFKSVMARKSRKVMTALMRDFNIMFKCTLMMTNAKLEQLPRLFKLPVEKQVGSLDYDLLRNSKTVLTEQELKYCEYDCLVVYYYIKEELKTYETVKNIPSTSTGHVRRELKDITRCDFKYKRLLYKAINSNPIVYNRLQDTFAGGVTHASWLYADRILHHVNSYDETSAYPYVLVAYKYPSSEFQPVKLRGIQDMSKRFCYILTVEFRNVNSRYYNTYISSSKCRELRGCKYDNGRVISADSFTMTITDIDFYLILDCYDCEYTIKDAWYSTLAYLPKKFINFILDKYVKKTEYKGREEFELEYTKEKNKFNALYGMCVTNEIRANVIYDDATGLWSEEPLTNDEIVDALLKQKNKSFLNFATGVWCTAYARDNLFRRVMALDDYVVYMDTDSIKLVQGYDEKIIEDYNKTVEERIKYVSRALRIDISRFSPKDKYGEEHMLGLFEYETNGLNQYTYNKFKTMGAKKYCFERFEFKDKEKKEIEEKISITVAGVPKKGSICIKTMEDFNDGLYFPSSITNKKAAIYNDYQDEFLLVDYQGNEERICEKSSMLLIPASYTLGKSQDYQTLLIDNSSERARYNERGV